MYLSIQLHCIQFSTSADKVVVIILNQLLLTVCMGVILLFMINLKINHKYIHTHCNNYGVTKNKRSSVGANLDKLSK